MIDDIDRVEDANNSAIWGLLKDDEERDLFEDAAQIDMGQFDESERQFLIIDKDNSVVYDMRKAKDMEKLANATDVTHAVNLTNASFSNLNSSALNTSLAQPRPS